MTLPSSYPGDWVELSLRLLAIVAPASSEGEEKDFVEDRETALNEKRGSSTGP